MRQKTGPKPRSLAERLAAHFEVVPNGCWRWTASLGTTGYGQIKGHGRDMVSSHRAAFEVWVGPIPAGLYVCHRCDNPACINPDHLFLGSHADNMADMRKKGRNACGERHGTSRLRAEQVLAIRAAAGRHRDVAARFGVSRALVGLIKNRKIWTHLA